jgi:hypothetical protein
VPCLRGIRRRLIGGGESCAAGGEEEGGGGGRRELGFVGGKERRPNEVRGEGERPGWFPLRGHAGPASGRRAVGQRAKPEAGGRRRWEADGWARASGKKRKR